MPPENPGPPGPFRDNTWMRGDQKGKTMALWGVGGGGNLGLLDRETEVCSLGLFLAIASRGHRRATATAQSLPPQIFSRIFR